MKLVQGKKSNKKKSFNICARKVSIKKLLDTILRNLCEQNIQKEIFVQAKTFKKNFETCASKKKSFETYARKKFKKKIL